MAFLSHDLATIKTANLVIFGVLFIMMRKVASLAYSTPTIQHVLVLSKWIKLSILEFLMLANSFLRTLTLINWLNFAWGYGAEHIYEHVEDMLGHKINPWLKICWKYVSPLVIMILFIYCACTYNVLKMGTYEYPLWAHLMGMSMGILSTVWVPLYFLYSIIVAPGTKISEKFAYARTSILEDYPERKSLPANPRK